MNVFDLLRSAPGFRRLWLGNLISSSGDWIGWVAVSVLAMQDASSALALAGVFVAHYLPSALLAPVGGVLADRWDRRKILVWVTVGQCLVTVAMALAAWRGEVRWVQLLLALRSTAVAFIAPAERGAIPRLVARSQVVLANAVDSGTWSVMFTVGTALGGLIAALGPTTALSLDAGTFVVALLFYLRLPSIVPRSESQSEKETSVPPLAEILRWLWRQPKILFATFAKAPLSLASGAGWLALNLTAADKATGTTASIALGGFYATRGVGTAIGPWLAQRASANPRTELAVWTASYLVGIAATVGFWMGAQWSVWIPCGLLWGLAGGVNWVSSTAITQRDVPDRYRGRIGAIDTLSWMGAQCLAVSLSAWQVHQGHRLDPVLHLMCLLGALGFILLLANTARAAKAAPASSVK